MEDPEEMYFNIQGVNVKVAKASDHQSRRLVPEVRTSIYPPRLKSNTRRPLPEEKTVWPVFGINENLIQHKHIIGF